MIRLRPEWFPVRTKKKLHAHSAGLYRIMLDLPFELGISPTFNIFDLVEFKEPMVIPSKPFEPDPTFESDPIPECPPAKLPERREKIEQIMDDKIITTRNKNYQRYLVH